MIRPVSASSIVGLILAICLVDSAAAQRAKKPREIDVVANDYAFLPLAATISAGPTIFTFANRGKVTHEVSIGRLKSGATVEEFAKADAPGRRDLIERSVGILIAAPGLRPDGRILVDLMKGSTYVVFCNLKNTPEAPGHLTFGMYTSFTPR
jgi:plastocyanin